MNPITKNIFIKKIVEYSILEEPKEIPKQIKTYLNVNDNWAETVTNYLDFDWSEKQDQYGDTFWHYMAVNIRSKKFWREIAKKDDDFFKSWNLQAHFGGETVWHLAVKYIKLNEFWELISQKPDSFFQSWDLRDDNGDNVWNKAIGSSGITSEKFWENIASKKDIELFRSWSHQEKKEEFIWYRIIKQIKSEKFWEIIARKHISFFEEYWNCPNRTQWCDESHCWEGKTIWHMAVVYLESEKFWGIIANKDFPFFEKSWWNQLTTFNYNAEYDSYYRIRPKSSVCHYIAKYLKSEKFWETTARKKESFFENFPVKDIYSKSPLFWKYYQ
jgi:hypothetical protein